MKDILLKNKNLLLKNYWLSLSLALFVLWLEYLSFRTVSFSLIFVFATVLFSLLLTWTITLNNMKISVLMCLWNLIISFVPWHLLLFLFFYKDKAYINRGALPSMFFCVLSLIALNILVYKFLYKYLLKNKEDNFLF
ncbi:hypothetical protein SH2C18_44680 [Clostridium sediminicola]